MDKVENALTFFGWGAVLFKILTLLFDLKIHKFTGGVGRAVLRAEDDLGVSATLFEMLRLSSQYPTRKPNY